jgi:MFS family permease
MGRRARFGGLWRHPDFLKLWAGQTVSLFGTLMGRLAMSFTAIIVLGATPLQVALLNAAGLAPGLAIGLFAGVWVDRLRRRPLLVAADFGRALLLASIPAAWVLGRLRIEQLYVVALLVSVLTILFDVAYRSYLPSLVRREELVEGNSKLQASGSVAEVAGFGLAGAVVQALTAPVTILVDSVSFVLSAASLLLIRKAEPAPHPTEHEPDAWREIGEGLRLVRRSAVLWASAGATGTVHLFQSVTGAIFMLYVTRQLHLSPLAQGVIYAVGGASSFLGALVAERVTRRWGLGPTLVGSLVLYSAGALCVPLASGPLLIVLILLVAQQIVGDGAMTVYLVDQVSLLQASAPGHLQGRLNATVRIVELSAMLAGLLAGGVLGEAIGLRPTLFVGALGSLLASLWLVFSPVRALQDHPALPAEPAVAAG